MFLIKRALLESLADCGSFAAREDAIRAQASIKIDHLQATTAELDIALRVIDTERLAVALPSERGRKLQITDSGRLWLAANA